MLLLIVRSSWSENIQYKCLSYSYTYSYWYLYKSLFTN